jgi:hypothetical protein
LVQASAYACRDRPVCAKVRQVMPSGSWVGVADTNELPDVAPPRRLAHKSGPAWLSARCHSLGSWSWLGCIPVRQIEERLEAERVCVRSTESARSVRRDGQDVPASDFLIVSATSPARRARQALHHSYALYIPRLSQDRRIPTKPTAWTPWGAVWNYVFALRLTKQHASTSYRC